MPLKAIMLLLLMILISPHSTRRSQVLFSCLLTFSKISVDDRWFRIYESSLGLLIAPVLVCASLTMFTCAFCNLFLKDFKENMLAHKENWQYVEWDIESTASILSRRFPASHVWVVKAAHMIHGTYNIFSNLVRWKEHASGAVGPVHESGHRSWHHLRLLLDNAVYQMNTILNDGVTQCTASTEREACGSKTFNASLPTTVVGFSKGCVVLNQLTYDLAEIPKDDDVEDFIKLVTCMYWLDGGHGGGSNTWITDENVLASLSRFEIYSHVTPYQVHDPSRPWIGREQEKFVTILLKHKTRVKNTLHFADQGRSLENHFRILHVF